MESTRPSKKQRELLSFIDGFIKGHGYGPSYREIMRALNYKSVSTVAVHVGELIKKGQLVKRDRSARSLEVVASTGTAAPTVKPIEKGQEKWLVDQINKKFTAAETAMSQAVMDELFVLVGALHILGLDDAYRACKSRLIDLQTKTTA